MESNVIKCQTVSHCVTDPYLPAVVVIGEEHDFVEFISYYRGDCGLVELQAIRGKGTVCQVTITMCDWFDFKPGHAPVPDAVEGLFVVGRSQRIENASLFVTVYDDGVDIRLTDKIPMAYVRSGDVIFGISADEEACQVILANLTIEETGHTKRLLQEDWEVRRSES